MSNIKIYPELLYNDKLKILGYNSNIIDDSKKIFYGAFGLDFFTKINFDLQNKSKGSIQKLLRQNLIYKYCEQPTLENILRLIQISSILKKIACYDSVTEYIKRLKSDENCYPALFELFFAKHLIDKGYKVDLQKANKLGNPVEVSFSDEYGNIYRTECKASNYQIKGQNIGDRIFTKLNKTFSSIPNGIGINIVLNDDISTIEDNISAITHSISSNLSEIKGSLSAIDKNIKVKFEFGFIECLPINDYNNRDIQSYFHKHSTEFRFGESVKQEDLKELINNKENNNIIIDNAIGIKYFINKEEKLVNQESLISDILDKIKQQKNLLEDQVIINLDNKKYSVIKDNKVFINSLEKYKNLSIILSEYNVDIDKGFVKEFEIIKQSNGFNKNIIL